MFFTIGDFRDNVDEIAILYYLLTPEEVEFSNIEFGTYYNSIEYHSPLYRFVYELTDEQRDIINIAIIIGYWLYNAPMASSNDYLEDINKQFIHVDNVETWCSKLRSNGAIHLYLKTFLHDFLAENL